MSHLMYFYLKKLPLVEQLNFHQVEFIPAITETLLGQSTLYKVLKAMKTKKKKKKKKGH